MFIIGVCCNRKRFDLVHTDRAIFRLEERKKIVLDFFYRAEKPEGKAHDFGVLLSDARRTDRKQ